MCCMCYYGLWDCCPPWVQTPGDIRPTRHFQGPLGDECQQPCARGTQGDRLLVLLFFPKWLDG